MAKTRGTGLLMAWTDVDPAQEDAFNAWYNEEHMGRLARVPGFLSGARYAALRGGPKYLAMYELEDHNVLRSTQAEVLATLTRNLPENYDKDDLRRVLERIEDAIEVNRAVRQEASAREGAGRPQ